MLKHQCSPSKAARKPFLLLYTVETSVQVPISDIVSYKKTKLTLPGLIHSAIQSWLCMNDPLTEYQFKLNRQVLLVLTSKDGNV